MHAALVQQGLSLLESAVASCTTWGDGIPGLALHLMLPFLNVITRSQKAQGPKVCPKGGSKESKGEDRPPEAHS